MHNDNNLICTSTCYLHILLFLTFSSPPCSPLLLLTDKSFVSIFLSILSFLLPSSTLASSLLCSSPHLRVLCLFHNIYNIYWCLFNLSVSHTRKTMRYLNIVHLIYFPKECGLKWTHFLRNVSSLCFLGWKSSPLYKKPDIIFIHSLAVEHLGHFPELASKNWAE